MKRLAEVTEAKQKAEEDAKKFREQLEREAEAKRILMENNKKIEIKYKEIENMVHKVRQTGIQDDPFNERASKRGAKPQETLIEVHGERDFEEDQDDNPVKRNTISHMKHPQGANQNLAPARQSVPKKSKPGRNQPGVESRSSSPIVNQPSLVGTAHFGQPTVGLLGNQSHTWASVSARPPVPKPTDLLCPPTLSQTQQNPSKPMTAQTRLPNPSSQSRSPPRPSFPNTSLQPSISPRENPQKASLPTQPPLHQAPSQEHQPPHPHRQPTSTNASHRERFLLPRRDGDSLERLEANTQDLTPRDDALLTRGDYEQELALRAKRAKERLEAAELRKMEERKQNMLGMFKDFREEVQNILSSYREVDPDKVESSQRDSIRKNLHSSMRRVEAEVHRAPFRPAEGLESSEEEARNPKTLQQKNRHQPLKPSQTDRDDDSDDSQDQEDKRAAKVLASKRERLAELREKKRKEIQAALGSTKGDRGRLKRHDHKSSSSSESDENIKLPPQRTYPQRADIIQGPLPRQGGSKAHFSEAEYKLKSKTIQNQGNGRPQPRSYLETSGEEDDDLRYTNTKQSSLGMEGTFGLPSMGKPGSSSKHTNLGLHDNKPKIRLVSDHSHPSQTSKPHAREDFAQAPSIGDRSLDEMTEDQLLIVKEMIEQRIASAETRQNGKKTRKVPLNHEESAPRHRDDRPVRKVHTPAQDVTIDDDFYDDNFISLVYELNTGAS